jgi:pSer/pThr/pTyr-binding forkhead associated (FHA) protein
MLRLIMRRGPTPGAVFELREDEITIGRGSKNDIIIRDNEVSREHARLVRHGDSYELVDLNSSNGTFINGQRVVTRWMLRPGMILELGDTITIEIEQFDPITIPTTPLKSTSEALSSAELLAQQAGAVLYRCLVITGGAAVETIYRLDGPQLTVGRDLANDIIIQEPEVSRFHMRLRQDGDGYLIEDLNSTNGTFVNGQRLTGPRLLRIDDTIALGMLVHLEYRLKAEAADMLDDSQETPTDFLLDTSFFNDDTLDGSFLDSVAAAHQTTALGTGLEAGALKDHIFIAYARRDWETLVASLVIYMQDAGLNAWVDQYLAPGGADWRAALAQALDECIVMVLVASSASMSSQQIRAQYRYFLAHDKPVLMLLYDHAPPLPEELAHVRTITYDADSPRKCFDKLTFEIMQHRR